MVWIVRNKIPQTVQRIAGFRICRRTAFYWVSQGRRPKGTEGLKDITPIKLQVRKVGRITVTNEEWIKDFLRKVD